MYVFQILKHEFKSDLQKHWLVEMPPTTLPTDVTILDDIQKNRLRTLMAVDEMVGAVVTKLKQMNVYDDAYLIFTSDNGFHIGLTLTLYCHFLAFVI